MKIQKKIFNPMYFPLEKWSLRSGRLMRLILVALVVPVASVSGQEETIRIETNLVSVPVTVVDRDGRYISGLKKSDFRLLEAGVEQRIEVFEPTDLKFGVVLLLDVSGSMIYDMGGLERAAETFVSKLRPNDQIMVATFSDRITSFRGFASVEDFRRRDPMRLRPDGRPAVTMVYDAAEFAMNKVEKIKGRKAIVFLTDGIGQGIWASKKSNLQRAEEGDATIYTIGFDTNPPERLRYETKKNYDDRLKAASDAVIYLADLAHKSGGRAFRIGSIQDLNRTFAEVVDELSRQYSLGYYSNREGVDGERRRITVKVNVPNVAVRSRNEVIYKKSKK